MSTAGDTAYMSGGLLAAVSSDAIVAFSDAGVTSNLCRFEYQPKADTIGISVWNKGTNQLTSADMAAHTEGASTSASLFNSDRKTITLAEYTMRADLTYAAINSSVDQPEGNLGQVLGNGARAKIDNLLNALFDGFTGNAVAGSTAALTVDQLYQAYGLIDSDSDGQMPLSGVFHPGQLNGTYGLSNDLITSANFTATDIQNAGLRSAQYGEVAGINLFRSREFTVTSNAVKAGVFRRDAIAWGASGPSEIISIKEFDDIDRATFEYVAYMYVGVIELVDDYGCEVWTRAT